MEFDSFNQILIWPLQILGGASLKPADFLAACERQTGNSSPWCPGDLYERIPDPHDEDTRFAEFVYFHPFVQRFLYARTHPHGGHEPALRLLTREDVKSVRVTLNLGDPPRHETITLGVNRVHLYFFCTHVAFLVVEVSTSSDQHLKRDVVLELQDRLRHAYTPCWNDAGPGLVPVKVEWLGNDDCIIATSDYENKASYETVARNYRVPPVSKHWAALLSPLEPYMDRIEEDVLYFSQIEDERIPAMTFLTVKHPDQISEGDWIRLTCLDGAGDPATKPYSSNFLSDFVKSYWYDRFWDPAAGMLTRYLCCGYAFTVVTESSKERTKFLHRHFRHHYFQLGLIAHFHRASLLVFSDRLSCERSCMQIQLIQNEIADFVGKFWFKEISSQVMARELFELWSRHLNTAQLFQQVMSEKKAVADIANDIRTENVAIAVRDLTLVTVIALPFLLGLAFLAVEQLRKGAESYSIPGLGGAGTVLLISAILATVLLVMFRRKKQ